MCRASCPKPSVEPRRRAPEIYFSTPTLSPLLFKTHLKPHEGHCHVIGAALGHGHAAQLLREALRGRVRRRGEEKVGNLLVLEPTAAAALVVGEEPVGGEHDPAVQIAELLDGAVGLRVQAETGAVVRVALAEALEAPGFLQERVTECSGEREDAADAPAPLRERHQRLPQVGVTAVDPLALSLVVGDVVDGQLYSLAVADEENASVAHVGGGEARLAALLEEEGGDRGGSALGAADAALAERAEETGRGLDEVEVRAEARLRQRLEAKVSLGPLLADEVGEVIGEPLGDGEAAVAVVDAVDGVRGAVLGVGVGLLGTG